VARAANSSRTPTISQRYREWIFDKRRHNIKAGGESGHDRNLDLSKKEVVKMRMISNEAAEARPVRKFTIQDAHDWMEWSGVSLSDVVNEDETPEIKLDGVGFSRVPKGATRTSNLPTMKCSS
jgi:hypothetical protein